MNGGADAQDAIPVNAIVVIANIFFIISIPFPANMIGTKELKMMKPTAILINTARGGLVDEAALAEETPARMIETAGEFMWNRPGFPRLLIALTLENRNITDIMGDHPFIRTLAKALADNSDVEDPSEAAVVLITSAVSAAVLGRAANVAIGRDSDDPRIARELVRSALMNAGLA